MIGLLAAVCVLATPVFAEHTEALGTQPCGGSPGEEGCFTNYTLLADLDGDADLDILFPNADGYFAKGPASPFVVLRNDGALVFADVSSGLAGGHVGWVRQVAAGDIDGDGDLDLYAPGAFTDVLSRDGFYVNQGAMVFTDEVATRMGGITSRAGAARFGDIDGDGDLDLLLADWGNASGSAPWTVNVYRNDGTGHFTESLTASPDTSSADGATPIDLDLADFDGDFDLDLLVNAHEGNHQLWLNDGLGTFTDASGSLGNQVGSFLHYGPAVCDVDGDLDLDIWSDNAAAGRSEQLLMNDGAGTFVDQTSSRVTGNSGADDNQVACVDIDQDSDLDAVIASLSGEERVLRNDGIGNFTALPDAFPAVGDSTLWIDFGDLDGDGDLDAVTAQGEGTPWLNRLYTGTNAMIADVRVPKFRALETLATIQRADITRIRFAVTDSVVTDIGPRLSDVRFEYTVLGGEPATAAAHFMGGDLFLARIPAAGGEASSVTYRACATDAAGNDNCSVAVTASLAPSVGGDDDDDDDTGLGKGCGCSLSSEGKNGSLLLLATAFLLVASWISHRPR